MINGIDNNNILKRDLQRKLASVYDSTSIANYVDNPANANNVEALADAIKNKKQVILKHYESAHSDEARDRLVEPIEFTANMIDVWAFDIDNGETECSRFHASMRLKQPTRTGNSRPSIRSPNLMYSE